jgi:mannose-6-phosphate isomerase
MTGYPPLAFQPIYKQKVWGGRSLETVLGRTIPAEAPIGESWEISGYRTDPSVVASGPLAKRTLPQLFAENQRWLVAPGGQYEEFPLLFKFIDAQDRLSVQVHPDDRQARVNGWGNFGKTECWYIVHAEPGSQTIAGFRRPVTVKEIEDAVRADSLRELLNFVNIQGGDLLLIRAGTVHANLSGTLLYEVQQSSDTTLRFYDWGRNAPDRPLHLEDCLKVVDTSYHAHHRIEPVALDSGADGVTCLCRVATRYFAICEFLFSKSQELLLPQVKSFRAVTGLGGHAVFDCGADAVSVDKGQSVMLPASVVTARVRADAGARLLVSWIPELASDIVKPARTAGASVELIEQLSGNPAKSELRGLIAA